MFGMPGGVNPFARGLGVSISGRGKGNGKDKSKGKADFSAALLTVRV
jgi:hypothetical protein